MNRRSFMKSVGGALVGFVALGLLSKTKPNPKFMPCLLYKYDPKMANIDPTSDWAKQTFDESILDMPQRTRLEFNNGEISPLLQSRCDMNKYKLGCKSLKNLKPLSQNEDLICQ